MDIESLFNLFTEELPYQIIGGIFGIFAAFAGWFWRKIIIVKVISMWQRIRDRGDPSKLPRCPKPLFNRPSYFVGRRDLLSTIKEQLRTPRQDQKIALIAVEGAGGIGKTTVAKVIAHDVLEENIFRAVLWVEVTREDPSMQRILKHWTVNFIDEKFNESNMQDEDFAAYVKRNLDTIIEQSCRCQASQMLVIFDDVWENGCDVVKKIYEDVLPTGVTILITTRNIRVSGELNAEPQQVNYMSDDDGADLLAADLRSNFGDELLRKHRDDLRTLNRVLGGHSLSLNLAARSIKKRTLSIISDVDKIKNLRDEIKNYQERVADAKFEQIKLEHGETKQNSLEASLSYTYDNLLADDQKRFRQLGTLIFDQPFSATMLADLWGGARENVQDSIDTLLASGLIEIDDGTKSTDKDAPQAKTILRWISHLKAMFNKSSNGSVASDSPYVSITSEQWYRQHGLLRAYARALLIKADEERTAFDGYCRAMIHIADQFYDPRKDDPLKDERLKMEQWHTLDGYVPHLLHVGDTLTAMYEKAETPDETLTHHMRHFALNTVHYLIKRRELFFRDKDWKGRTNWFEQGLQASQQEATAAAKRHQAYLMNKLALLPGTRGQKDGYIEAALSIWRELDDPAGQADALHNKGRLLSDRDEKRQALAVYEEALPLWQQAQDQGGEAITRNNIGMIWDALDDKQQALDYFQQALPLFQAVGDRGGEAWTRNNIGGVWSALGDKQQALDYFQQALSLMREVGNRHGEAGTLNNIGKVYNDLGEYKQALDYFQQALSLMRAVGDRGGEATTLNNMGGVWNALGDKQQALDYLQQALPLRRAVGHRGGEAVTLNNMTQSYEALDRHDEAIDHAQQAIDLFEDTGLTRDEVGDTVEMYEKLRRRVQQRLPAAIRTLLKRASKSLSEGDADQTLKLSRQALSKCEQLEHHGGQAFSLQGMAAAHVKLGDTQQAITCVEQAIAIFADNDITYDADGDPIDVYKSFLAALKGESESKSSSEGNDDPIKVLVSLLNSASEALKQGDGKQALERFKLIFSVIEDADLPQIKTLVLWGMAQAHEKLGDTQQAITCIERAIAIFKQTGITSDASEDGVETYEQYLAALKGRSGGV